MLQNMSAVSVGPDSNPVFVTFMYIEVMYINPVSLLLLFKSILLIFHKTFQNPLVLLDGLGRCIFSTEDSKVTFL